MRPTAPSKVYTCHTCGHEGPYVVADECHSCWMRRINEEPESESLLPKERTMSETETMEKETTVEEGKTTVVKEEQSTPQPQEQSDDSDDGSDQG